MKKVRYLLFLSLVLLVFGCKQEEENPDPSIEKVTENPNPPENNSEIVLEKTFGDDTKFNEIIKMKLGYYIGREGSQYYFGKIDNFGNVEWKRQLDFVPVDFISNNNAILRLIVVGGANTDSNSDDYEEGRVVIYDENGTQENSISYTETGHKILFRSISPSETFYQTYQIVGMATDNTSNIDYPYSISLKGDLSDFLGSGKVFNEFPNRVFNQIQMTTVIADNGGIGTALLVSGNEGANTSNKLTIYRYDTSLSTLSWSTDIIDNSGLKSIIGFDGLDVDYTNDAVYVFSNTEFEKETNPESGGYWRAGLFAKLNLKNGNIEWLRSHSFSDKTDRFFGGFLHEGNLYAYGEQSTVFYNYEDGTSSAFGNGIVAKINPANGDLISSHTFGDKTNQSTINTAFVNDNKIYLGGFTGYTGSDSGSENWFLVVNP